jgi:hypothetical protein
MDKSQCYGQTAFGFSVDKAWTSGFAVLRIATRPDHTLTHRFAHSPKRDLSTLVCLLLLLSTETKSRKYL